MSESEHLNYLFDDPSCVTPDIAHPHIHAAMNIGRGLAFIAQRAAEATMERKGSLPERSLHAINGMTSATFLIAARIAPDWADAFLASIPDDEREILDHNAGQLVSAYPLSPLDKAMAEGAKS